jgi:hypothetical protein
VIEKVLPAPPAPPRQVIVERLPPAPPKPRQVIYEKWLPYEETKERPVIVERAAPAELYVEISVNRIFLIFTDKKFSEFDNRKMSSLNTNNRELIMNKLSLMKVSFELILNRIMRQAPLGNRKFNNQKKNENYFI